MRYTFFAIILPALMQVMTGCSGDQARYDEHARAFDPAQTSSASATSNDTEHNMPDPADSPADLNTPQAQANDNAIDWAAYNAALLAEPVELTDEQWHAILSDEEFRILRRSGTERSFTGRYLDKEDDGTYHCAGCGLYLYDAAHKFHSGCGWPSFNQEVAQGVLAYYTDHSVGMTRTEMRCARCDGHLGHVFNDAPSQPTGLRHCVNGGAILFIPEGKDPQQAIAEHRAQFADQ
ncbi:MAG: peptide-methionine (R)-S-oxide reductase MsrB [Phycisphaerales bacterium JB063]